MSERLQRVSEELREILAAEIQKLKDPRLGFVTVTGVKVTPDLHHARVYYTVLVEEKEHRGTAAALRSASPHLRAALGHQVRMKFTPDLLFEEDPGATGGERVEEILRQIRAQDEAGGVDGAAGGPGDAPEAQRDEEAS